MAINTVEDINPQHGVTLLGTTPKGSGRVAASLEPVTGSMLDIDIIDIRCDAVETDLKDEILSLLKPEKGIRKLPTLLLYDEKGLQLFEEVKIRLHLGYLASS
jgi:hypothetical protein